MKICFVHCSFFRAVLGCEIWDANKEQLKKFIYVYKYQLMNRFRGPKFMYPVSESLVE